ncbi:MAG: hypothetical protein CVU39_26265 [Chloroflexi bacterium HGW-Chloroflexi-10]|nr:MAG: hypothetical protein CVU39_26265 [Chloroflexi bacterium HGW-Chloroflexi-10]
MSIDQTKSSLGLLLTISRELATTLDLKEALFKVIQLSMQNVGAERGSLIAVNEKMEPIEAAIITDGRPIKHTIGQLRTLLEHGLAGNVINNQTSVWIRDTSKDDRWLRRPDDDKDQTGAKSAICMPLKARDSMVGVLTIVHPQPDYFTQEQFIMLEAIADLAGIAIHNASLYASLQSSNQRYQELFEDSIDPIFITDWNGKITESNRQGAKCIGKSNERLQKFINDFHSINWQEVGEKFVHLRAGKTASYESEMHCIEQNLPVEIHVRKAIINEQEVLQWIIRDISERKALDSLREDLMAMIYHDLRSPLANIISSLDILNSLLPDQNDQVRPVFQIAVRSTDRMQRLINSLLDIKRLEAGQPIANMKAIRIDEMIHEASETVDPTAQSKRQAILIDVPSDLPEMMGDENMLKRVLINLLENAIKFSPLDGNIQIGARIDDAMFSIWVADSGPGIPNEARDRIFNKFTRLQAKQFPKGIGLGLAFCKLAVTAHNGKIWVDSEAGSGSRFNILLPVKQDTLPE